MNKIKRIKKLSLCIDHPYLPADLNIVQLRSNDEKC